MHRWSLFGDGWKLYCSCRILFGSSFRLGTGHSARCRCFRRRRSSAEASAHVGLAGHWCCFYGPERHAFCLHGRTAAATPHGEMVTLPSLFDSKLELHQPCYQEPCPESWSLHLRASLGHKHHHGSPSMGRGQTMTMASISESASCSSLRSRGSHDVHAAPYHSFASWYWPYASARSYCFHSWSHCQRGLRHDHSCQRAYFDQTLRDSCWKCCCSYCGWLWPCQSCLCWIVFGDLCRFVKSELNSLRDALECHADICCFFWCLQTSNVGLHQLIQLSNWGRCFLEQFLQCIPFLDHRCFLWFYLCSIANSGIDCFIDFHFDLYIAFAAKEGSCCRSSLVGYPIHQGAFLFIACFHRLCHLRRCMRSCHLDSLSDFALKWSFTRFDWGLSDQSPTGLGCWRWQFACCWYMLVEWFRHGETLQAISLWH